MSLADAWMLKGWLMRDERATPEIMAAVEAVISALANPRIETPIPLIQLPAQTDAEVDPPDTSAPKRRGGSDEAKAAAAERMRVRLASRREAKASSSLSAIFHGSEGLRKLETGCASITSGMSNHAGTEIDNPPFGVKVDGCGLDAVSRKRSESAEPNEISDDFPSAILVPAKRDGWESAELSLDDWPFIQKMLAAGNTREKIAGDYDVPVLKLTAFIEHQVETGRARRASKETPPGEVPAPLPSMVGGAN